MNRSKIIAWLMTCCILAGVRAQQSGTLEGKVSFISGDNVYVKLTSTKDITVGDTLFLSSAGARPVPALVVKARSSSSLVTSRLGKIDVKVGDAVSMPIRRSSVTNLPAAIESLNAPVTIDSGALNQPRPVINTSKKPTVPEGSTIHGRLTLSHMQNMSFTESAQSSRQMGVLSLYTVPGKGQNLAAETYLHFSRVGSMRDGKSAPAAFQMRVFNLAIRYERGNDRLIAGRRMSDRLLSLNAIDGVQYERKLGQWYAGALAGFRPDIADYGFDFRRLQYGAYAGHESKGDKWNAQTTIGYVEQRLNGATDRRYAAVQHATTINRLSLFASSELELYNPSAGSVRLSSLYASASYRTGSVLSLLLSYDSRRTIIYYESYVGEIDRYLSNDINFQGIRLRANLRMTRQLTGGIGAGIRKQSDGNGSATNLNAFLSHARIPAIGGSVWLSANATFSSVMDNYTAMARYTRSFSKEKLQAGVYYRFQRMDYVLWSNYHRMNHFGGLSIQAALNGKLSLQVYGDFSAFSNQSTGRMQLSITKRL